MKVLITGFEPNDHGLNASELLVKSLRDRPPSKAYKYDFISKFSCFLQAIDQNTHYFPQVINIVFLIVNINGLFF